MDKTLGRTATAPGEAEATPLRVDVWADIVCPWCAIGHRRLAKAVAKWGKPVHVVHRGFQLDPHQHGSLPVRDFLRQRYGPGADLDAMFGRVTSIAAGEGLHFRFDQAITTNTMAAHKVLLAAQDAGIEVKPLYDALADAHFGQGLDVADPKVLEDAAKAVGFGAEQVQAALAEVQLTHRVRTDQHAAREMGVGGVPFFLAGRHGVSGAQPVDALLQLLEAADAARQP